MHLTHTHLPLTDVCLDTWDCEYQIALSKHTTGAEYTISYRTSAHFGSPVQREPTEQHVKLPSNKWVWRHLTHGPAIVRLKNCVKSQYWSLTRPRKWFTECLRRGFSSERLTDWRTDRRTERPWHRCSRPVLTIHCVVFIHQYHFKPDYYCFCWPSTTLVHIGMTHPYWLTGQNYVIFL